MSHPLLFDFGDFGRCSKGAIIGQSRIRGPVMQRNDVDMLRRLRSIGLGLASILLCLDHAAAARDTAVCADDANLRLPRGFCASIVADRIGHARHMAVSSDGILYVNTWADAYA